MSKHSIVAKTMRKFKATTDSKHFFPVAGNILEQNFYTGQPNQIWLADITYSPTGEGWLYLATIVVLFNREVVGWAMDSIKPGKRRKENCYDNACIESFLAL